jgi:hypothetical protein
MSTSWLVDRSALVRLGSSPIPDLLIAAAADRMTNS